MRVDCELGARGVGDGGFVAVGLVQAAGGYWRAVYLWYYHMEAGFHDSPHWLYYTICRMVLDDKVWDRKWRWGANVY